MKKYKRRQALFFKGIKKKKFTLKKNRPLRLKKILTTISLMLIYIFKNKYLEFLYDLKSIGKVSEKVRVNFLKDCNVFRSLSITPRCLSVVLGSLLGDLSIGKPPRYKNARIQMKHGWAQSAYFHWKVKELIIFKGKTSVVQPGKNSKGSTPLNRIISHVHTDLTKIKLVLSPGNRKILLKSWLHFLGPIGLLCWYLDDGTLTMGRTGKFCCENFTQLEQSLFVDYFKNYWNIEAHIVPLKIGVGSKQWIGYRLQLNVNELKKFLLIIAPFLPVKEMLYKFCIKYKDVEKQTEWIAALTKAAPTFALDIQNFYKKISP